MGRVTQSARVLCILLSILAEAACATPPLTLEQRDGNGTVAPAAFVDGVTSSVLTSSATGREYQVSVAVPLGYEESDERFPILVGVDANGQYGTLVETARILRLGEQVPPLIVVGIGFPVGGYQTLSEPRRPLELAPTEVAGFEEEWIEVFPDLGTPTGSGRADELLRFLLEDAIPFVDSQYRTQPTGRALYGHSLGGLFSFYSLLNSNGAFSRFIIASPSLWWDDRVAFELESDYAGRRRGLPARVFFSVGLQEADQPGRRMVSNLRDLLAVLETRTYEGLVWESHFFEGENHQSVIAPAISRGLRYVFQ